jgi:hypothetical protein
MRREAWRVALLYVALTGLLAYPLTVSPAGSVLSATPDTNLFLWALSWDVHAFTHRPLSIFNANIYYPEHLTLAYSENFIGSALFAAPIVWLTGNAVLALNAITLLSAVLCGVGAYMLARRVGEGQSAATLSGLIFAFSPPRFLRISQLHLAVVQWMPFGLAFLHAYLDGGRKTDLRLAVAFLTVQAFSSGHGAVFLLLAMAGLVAYRVALGEPIALSTRLRDLGIPGLLLLAPTVLIAVPYRIVQVEMGLRRSPDDWTSTWSSFLASPSHVQRFLLSWIPDARINETAWAYLFPGYLPILLALCAVWRFSGARKDEGAGRRSKVWTRAAGALELISLISLIVSVYVSATGPLRLRAGGVVLFSARDAWRAWIFSGVVVAARIAIARRAPFEILPRMKGRFDAVQAWRRRLRHDAMPFYALLTLGCMWLAAGPPGGLWPLVAWLPGLNFVRVPSRFSVLGMLGLAVLAGAGFERLTAGLTHRRRLMASALVGSLLVVEFAAMPLHTEPYHVEIPPIDRWLDSRPRPFAIAEVPLPSPRDLGAWERRQSLYMLHSMAHWQKTVHGYSGLRPALHDQIYEDLLEFPDEKSVRRLSELGVDYVVVHTDLYAPGAWTTVEQRLGLFEQWLTLAHVEGAGRVYSLQRPSAGVTRP